MTGEERSEGRTRMTAEAIESYRLCLDHDPQPMLGQFNWPMVLGFALDEIEALRRRLDGNALNVDLSSIARCTAHNVMGCAMCRDFHGDLL
jgi:hypothetical protein